MQDPSLQRFDGPATAQLAWGFAASGCLQDSVLSAILLRVRSLPDPLPDAALAQLHVCLLHVALHPQQLPYSNALLETLHDVTARCRAVFLAAQVAAGRQTEASRGAVARGLRELGFACKEAVAPADAGGYSVDVLLPRRRLALALQGPLDVVQRGGAGQASGAAVLRYQQLQQCGYEVMVLPDLSGLGGGEEMEAYLRRMIATLDMDIDPAMDVEEHD